LKIYVAYISVNDDKSADAAQFPCTIGCGNGIGGRPNWKCGRSSMNNRAKPVRVALFEVLAAC
jgi:hypothetical protein